MIFTLFLNLFVAARATDLCLPLTHQGWVVTSRWAEDEYNTSYTHHYDEFREGDFMYIWSDGATRKTLAHVYEKDHFAGHFSEEHHYFSLRDYTKKYHWFGHYNFTTQSSTECWLELFDSKHRPWGPYCFAKQANLRGSGTVGENVNVDFWESDFQDPFGRFSVEIDTILEKGSTTIPLQERVDGQFNNGTNQWYFAEHREWFDFSTAPIDASKFNVPQGCPNP